MNSTQTRPARQSRAQSETRRLPMAREVSDQEINQPVLRNRAASDCSAILFTDFTGCSLVSSYPSDPRLSMKGRQGHSPAAIFHIATIGPVLPILPKSRRHGDRWSPKAASWNRRLWGIARSANGDSGYRICNAIGRLCVGAGPSVTACSETGPRPSTVAAISISPVSPAILAHFAAVLSDCYRRRAWLMRRNAHYAGCVVGLAGGENERGCPFLTMNGTTIRPCVSIASA